MQVRHGDMRTERERERERETMMLGYSAGSLHHVRHGVIIEILVTPQQAKNMIKSEQRRERSIEIKVKFSIPCQRFPPEEKSVHI